MVGMVTTFSVLGLEQTIEFFQNLKKLNKLLGNDEVMGKC